MCPERNRNQVPPSAGRMIIPPTLRGRRCYSVVVEAEVSRIPKERGISPAYGGTHD